MRVTYEWILDGLDKKEQEQLEEDFQKNLALYDSNNNDKDAWDRMFIIVSNVCHNVCAKKLSAIRIEPDEFENRFMNASMYVMEMIKKGARPLRLSSYCYLRCIKFLYAKENQFYDKLLNEADLEKDFNGKYRQE